jgi:hypothetical protein
LNRLCERAAAKLDYRVEIDAPRELKDVLEKRMNIARLATCNAFASTTMIASS